MNMSDEQEVLDKEEYVGNEVLEIDPIEEVKQYVNYRWLQKMVPVRTACYHCKKDSPVIYVHQGVATFNHPERKRRGYRDITEELRYGFADLGWKIQLNRSFCPDCKGLGSV